MAAFPWTELVEAAAYYDLQSQQDILVHRCCFAGNSEKLCELSKQTSKHASNQQASKQASKPRRLTGTYTLRSFMQTAPFNAILELGREEEANPLYSRSSLLTSKLLPVIKHE